MLRAFAYVARYVKSEIELGCSIIGFEDKTIKKLVKVPNKMIKVSKTIWDGVLIYFPYVAICVKSAIKLDFSI